MSTDTGRSTLLGLGYVAVYVALDAVSFVQPLLKLGITPWNPQAGLTLAFLLWRGPRHAGWTFAAALLAEIVVRGMTAPGADLAAAAAAIAVCYGTVAYALRRCALVTPIASARDAVLVLLGSTAAALVVALAYVALFVRAGALPVGEAGHAVARYWVGDLNGVLTLAPLLLMLAHRNAAPVAAPPRWGLRGLQVLVLAAALWLVFGARPGQDVQFVYALFVPMVSIALAEGVVGATLATLAVQLGLMAGLDRGFDAGSIVELQFLLVTLGVTALLLGAVVEERARALVQLAAREAEQRALLQAAPDAVLSTDREFRVTSANPVARRMLEAQDSRLEGARLGDLLPGFAIATDAGRAQVRVAGADGASVPVEVAWVALDAPAGPGHLLIARDVTEREQAQAEIRRRDAALARAMRAALAGELASALTHELNQPITALVSYLEAVDILAQPLAERDARLAGTVAKANREAIRASDVLRRLRDFYRGGASAAAPVDVQALVRDVLAAFADRASRLGVELQEGIGGPWNVELDVVQLQMVLHNLVTNALDALEAAKRGGCIRIDAIRSVPAHLRVADDGPGIAPQVARELFEPFTTDKPDGMGLGLAISRSLMRSQGGDLRLERSGPEGTCFVVALPVQPAGELAA